MISPLRVEFDLFLSCPSGSIFLLLFLELNLEAPPPQKKNTRALAL